MASKLDVLITSTVNGQSHTPTSLKHTKKYNSPIQTGLFTEPVTQQLCSAEWVTSVRMIHHPTTESVYSWRPQRQCCCLGMAVLSFAVLVFFSPANNVLALGRCAGREHSGVFMSTDMATCWAMRRLNTWEITASNPSGEPGDPDSYLHNHTHTHNKPHRSAWFLLVWQRPAPYIYIWKCINMCIILSISIRKHSPQKQRRTEEHEKNVHLLKYTNLLIITNEKKNTELSRCRLWANTKKNLNLMGLGCCRRVKDKDNVSFHSRVLERNTL